MTDLDEDDVQEFLDELVEPSGAARAVKVHKRRVRYSLGGCLAEVADLEVDGRYLALALPARLPEQS